MIIDGFDTNAWYRKYHRHPQGSHAGADHELNDIVLAYREHMRDQVVSVTVPSGIDISGNGGSGGSGHGSSVVTGKCELHHPHEGYCLIKAQ